ncbi:FkbM family methyltransferase [Erythrobacter sp. JK5]|nr:FkbM family methyltransferase [Erythrobacter sp. JK5]
MLSHQIKRQLRSVQTFFPGIRTAKFSAYNWATRNLGWRVEPEFRLLDALAPCDLAVDIGGNWGQSIYALQRHAKPGKIVSFEPNPQLAARLKSTFAGDASVEVESCALGDTPGEFDLYLPSYRGYEYDGLASLDYDSAAKWLNPERMAAFNAHLLEIQRHRIEVRTLDSYDLAPDIVKIDVQGHEEAVIKGGLDTIARSQPVLIIEDPTEGLIALLADAGLGHFGLVDGKLIPGDLSQPNSLFLSDARRKLIAG